MKAVTGLLILALGGALVSAQSDLHWGKEGHAIVAIVAQGLLKGNAPQMCKTLLPEVGGDLSRIASWADEIKSNPAYNWANPLHYINTPDWACNYDRMRDCKSSICVDAAIQNYTSRLTSQSVSQAQKAEALKFLVHFIGDIHQPLHVGFANDKGGNSITGHWYTRKGNLHSFWDTSILLKKRDEKHQGSFDVYGKYLLQQVQSGAYASQVADWVKCKTTAPHKACSVDWANEATKFACDYAYVDADGKTPLKSGFTLGDAYYNRVIPIIDLEMARGGVRLANVLNSLWA